MTHGEYHRFRRKHLDLLQRRADFLAACEATGRANSYEKAERAALEAALGELRTVLEQKEKERGSNGQVNSDSAAGRR